STAFSCCRDTTSGAQEISTGSRSVPSPRARSRTDEVGLQQRVVLRSGSIILKTASLPTYDRPQADGTQCQEARLRDRHDKSLDSLVRAERIQRLRYCAVPVESSRPPGQFAGAVIVGGQSSRSVVRLTEENGIGRVGGVVDAPVR